MSLVEMLNRSQGEVNPDDFGVDVRLPKEELDVEHRSMGLLSRLWVRSIIGDEGKDRTDKCLVDASVMETKPLAGGGLIFFFSGCSDGADFRLAGDREMYLVMGDCVRSTTLCLFWGLLMVGLGQSFSLFTKGAFGCLSFTFGGLADVFDATFTLRKSDVRHISLLLGCELDGFGCSFFFIWSFVNLAAPLLLFTGA